MTSKFNLAEIMRNAIAIARTMEGHWHACLAEGLRQAWAAAKAPKATLETVCKYAGKTVKLNAQALEQAFDGIAKLSFKGWTGGANVRIYVGMYDARNSKPYYKGYESLAYIDCKTGKLVCNISKIHPRACCEKIENCIEIV